MEIIVNLFRSLMFFFDNIIYGLIPTIYKLFIYLSELNLYSNEEGNPLYQLIQHIYVLLGIFMLFKVSFSLLQYIVDPNAFRDSSKGMGKLVTNVIVALVLLVAVPYIFNVASELQRIVVQENVIGQLILGTSASGTVQANDEGNVTSVDTAKAEEMAKDLQFMLYGAFYNVSDSISACSETSGVLGSIDVARNDACLNFLNEGIAGEENAAANDVNLYSFFKHTPTEDDAGNEKCIDNVCDERDFSHFGSLLWWKDNGNYVIDYLPFISSAVGVYVVFLLISFSVDIAVRAIKLCFLQMLAPIAIVSYIDPKESISDGKLRRWVNESASTYFSLFLRLATIFFVMLLVEIISSSVLSNGGESYIGAQIDDPAYSIWIYLFLVIGAFMFAKQVPKMLDKIFKIENSGNLNLNPFKNEGFGALAGGAVGLGIGVAGAATGSGIGRIASGTLGGFKAGLGGKKIGEISDKQADINRRLGMARANGSTFTGRLGAKWSSFWGTPGKMGRVLNKQADQDEIINKANRSMADNNVRIQNATSYADFIKAQEDRAESQITDEKNMTSYAIEYRQRQAQVAALEAQMNSSTSQNERMQLSDQIQKRRNENAAWLENARYSYMDDNKRGTLKAMNAQGQMVSTVDHVLQGLDKDAMRAGEVIGIDNSSYDRKTASERHSDAGALRGQISDWKRENLPYESAKRAAEAEKEKLRVEEEVARANVQGANAKEGGARRRGGFGPGGSGPRGPRF